MVNVSSNCALSFCSLTQIAAWIGSGYHLPCMVATHWPYDLRHIFINSDELCISYSQFDALCVEACCCDNALRTLLTIARYDVALHDLTSIR